jgi:hypothetical protein
MAMDPVAILKGIGKQFGKRVSAANLFDPNVCKSPRDPERPWAWLELPGDIFRHKLNVRFGRYHVRFHANRDFIVVRIAGNFGLDVCSINRRMVAQHQSPLHVLGFPSLPLYSPKSNTDLRQFLNSGALTQALNALQLTKYESLHFFRNAIDLYLQRESKDEVMSAVEIVCKLADQFPAVEDSLDLAALPAKFENLFGLIPKWALSDDDERSEMLEETSLELLQSLVATVSPYLHDIDEYLDSFGDEPPPDAAVTLGTLAECCLEAQIRIRGRHEE